jgi:predicted component of type VI protein secretion system
MRNTSVIKKTKGNIENTIEDVISSYEVRIKSVGSIFDVAHQLLQGFQLSFLDGKQERESITAQLRDNLAKVGSLRHKDFDNMMQGVLSTQEEREKEVRDLLEGYLNEQRELAKKLRQDLKSFRQSLVKGEVRRVQEFKKLIGGILARQKVRKQEITARLKEFRTEQQEMAKKLKQLLAKGRELRIKDFKTMLNEFRNHREERMASCQMRRRKVTKMLVGFRKKHE